MTATVSDLRRRGCPPWCEREPGHEWDFMGEDEDGHPTRYHERTVGELHVDGKVVSVEVNARGHDNPRGSERLDSPILMLHAERVEVLSPDGARRLAAFLSATLPEAAALVEDLSS